MTGHRGAYLAALVVAVLVLLGSVAAVTVYVASHTHTTGVTAATDQSDGWGWDGMGGMMNDGDGSTNGDGWTMMGGSGTAVSLDQARAIAQDWVDANATGATLDAGTTMGGAHRFTVTLDGQTVAGLWVEAATGRVAVRTAATAPASPAG